MCQLHLQQTKLFVRKAYKRLSIQSAVFQFSNLLQDYDKMERDSEWNGKKHNTHILPDKT